MSHQYKVVPLVGAVEVKRKQNTQEKLASYLEEVINKEASDGWEFLQVETLQAAEPAGCLSNHKFDLVPQPLAVFRKERDEAAEPIDDYRLS